MEGREQKSIHKGGRETRGGRGGGMREEKRMGRGGRMDEIKQSTANKLVWTLHTPSAALCVCVCDREVSVFWECDSLDREGDGERWPEHGCLPGCCGLGPLTGASTLFSNTAHRQPDKTKTLIYTSLRCYPPIPYLCPGFCFCYLPVCTSIWLCFVARVYASIFLFVRRGASW